MDGYISTSKRRESQESRAATPQVPPSSKPSASADTGEFPLAGLPVDGTSAPVDRLAGGARRVPPKLYRIGEVVDYSGVSRQTIHNYTTMGLLHESRWTNGGHRLYDESVFERLDQIVRLKAQRKSMQDIREHFARLEGW